MNILVGMSGGVDSSVTALILKEQGHNVIGATMSIWRERGKCNEQDSINSELEDLAEEYKVKPHKCSHGACYGPDEKEDIESARKVCEQIGIPFYVFDCREQYEKIVIESFKREYLAGRTPNPCVWCNALIKFDLLPNLAKMNGIEFDKFATGHYASVGANKSSNGRYILKRGISAKKDQSYFLYRLQQEQLKNIILPLGGFLKEEIRQIAKNYSLEIAEKPDSQDFYEGDYNELLGIERKKGNIVNTEGKILGEHNGIWNYTIGQRKGLGVSSTEALYVVELREKTNEVVVGFKDKTMKDRLIATDLNWVSIAGINEEKSCTAKIRSTQEPTNVIIRPINNGIEVIFENLQKSIAPGQSVVFYDDDIVIGGGIIDSV